MDTDDPAYGLSFIIFSFNNCQQFFIKSIGQFINCIFLNHDRNKRDNLIFIIDVVNCNGSR
jgi:hypothetical protein